MRWILGKTGVSAAAGVLVMLFVGGFGACSSGPAVTAGQGGALPGYRPASCSHDNDQATLASALTSEPDPVVKEIADKLPSLLTPEEMDHILGIDWRVMTPEKAAADATLQKGIAAVRPLVEAHCGVQTSRAWFTVGVAHACTGTSTVINILAGAYVGGSGAAAVAGCAATPGCNVVLVGAFVAAAMLYVLGNSTCAAEPPPTTSSSASSGSSGASSSSSSSTTGSSSSSTTSSSSSSTTSTSSTSSSSTTSSSSGGCPFPKCADLGLMIGGAICTGCGGAQCGCVEPPPPTPTCMCCCYP